MNPTDVRAELAARLATIAASEDVVTHAYPPGRLAGPGFVVQPVDVAFDQTYKRGMDTMTYSVIAVGGRLGERATHERLDVYAAGDGAASVKAVLESGTYTAFESVTVMAGEWTPVTFEGIDHLAVVFTAEVVGSGS